MNNGKANASDAYVPCEFRGPPMKAEHWTQIKSSSINPGLWLREKLQTTSIDFDRLHGSEPIQSLENHEVTGVTVSHFYLIR